MRRIAARLTYANVVATIALVIAVGGGAAYAANTVFSTDIVDGEVKTADIATNAVRSTRSPRSRSRAATSGSSTPSSRLRPTPGSARRTRARP